MSSSASNYTDLLFGGPSEMHARCRALDWSKTELGAAAAWPQSLRTAAQMVLAFPFPSVILLGKDLIQLYNDGYRELMGTKHPGGLGQPTQQCWPELWLTNEPIYQRVWAGESLSFEDALYPLFRSGQLEDAWFTLAYSPVLDESGQVGGILITLIKTTDRLQAEQQQRQALRASEERYSTLFDAIDEGAGIIEMLYNEAGQPIDYLFHEVNQAYQKVTGQVNPAGKLGSEVAPNTEPYWLEAYDQVIQTGQSVRHERYHSDTGRWYTAFASRLGTAGSRMLGVVFEDITQRKQAQQHQAFLLAFSDALRAQSTADALANRALQLLIEHLKLDRSYITTYRLADDRADLVYQLGNDSVPPLPDHFFLSDFPQALKATFEGSLVIEDDEERQGLSPAEQHNSRQLGMRSMVAATLRKGDDFPLWSLVAISAHPRRWTPAEIKLIEDVAERTWAALERASAEAARRQSELHIRLAVKAAQMATWEWDLRSGLLDSNEQFFSLLGLPVQSGPGDIDQFLQRLYAEDREYVQTQLHQVSQQANPYEAEFRMVRADGAIRWMHGLGRVTAEVAGKPTQVSGVMFDITERKTAQETLRQSEQELSQLRHLTLLSQTETLARMGSWEYHRTSGLFSWSAGMYLLTQADSQRPLLPEIYLELAVEADQTKAQALISFLLAGEGHFEGQLRIQAQNATKTLRIKADVIGTGAQIRVVGVGMDITELLLAQRRIRETAENLQAVLDGSPASIGLLKAQRDEGGNIVDFRLAVGNEKLARFFGEPLSALLGQPAQRFSTLLWNGETLARLRHVFTTKESHYEEKPLPIPEQQTWVALSVTQQDDGVVLTLLDITLLKQAQRQQQYWLAELESSRHSVEALTQLKTALQYRSESLRAVSHDLKGNFGIINSSITLLELAESEAEREQFINMALRNVQQATGLLGELLDLTRLESSEQARQLSSQNVSNLLAEIGDSLTPLACQQGLTLSLSGPPALEAQTDTLLLFRLLQNLVINALKYTHQGQVSLNWGQQPGSSQWWFTVEDTGSGLAAHLVERLNAPDPLQAGQADPARTIGPGEPVAKES